MYSIMMNQNVIVDVLVAFDSDEDDVNIDDLIGDLTSFDELLNSLLNDEHNNPSEKNEEYKPSKKREKNVG